MPKTSRRVKGRGSRRGVELSGDGNAGNSDSPEAIKAAEQVALQAFASGLKIAAAFGSVAAKTTSIALASLATGADKFSDLIRQETLRKRSGPARKLNNRSVRHTRRGARKQ